jgi:hypothetical protein
MARYLLVIAGLALLLVAGAMLWQHLHYLQVRRDAVQDRQRLMTGKDAFHVVTFLTATPGKDLLESLRDFRRASEGPGQWIYAGKAVVNVPSRQMGPEPWSAVVLVQYPSRLAYETAAASPGYQASLSRFERSYSHGARRPPVTNLMLPQILLMKRTLRAVMLTPSDYPFTLVPPDQIPPQGKVMLSRLRAAHDLGDKAAVVVNLQKRGTSAQRQADARYVDAMTGLMAERGYGPMHIAPAEALPGSFDFDQLAIVYYPGTDYFADMFGSTFYQGIWQDKSLGDNQSTITVPLLDRL